MKLICFAFSIFFTLIIHAQTGKIVELWPNKVPNETQPKHDARQSENTSGNVIRLTDITNPILKVYQPEKPNNSNAAVIVCPGGGYGILAIDKEGYEVADWLNSLGYTAFVLQYRVPKNRRGALQDLQRAISWVRSKVKLYNLDTNKIGVMGFSAGGHLAANATINYHRPTYSNIDGVDTFSNRPDFTMLIYPAYLDKGQDRSLSEELTIERELFPFFVFGTADDIYGNSAIVIAQALRDKNIPVDLHLLAKGGHGYGLRKENTAAQVWPKLAEHWLKSITAAKPRLNDIQVIGSHNSYKIAIEQPLWEIINTKDSKTAKSLQYEHIPIEDQLNIGLRNLELDVFYDPQGGHYTQPKGLNWVELKRETPLPYDENEKLKTPGLKLFHVQDVDFRSHYLLFKEGLKAIKNWSDKNPNHLPVIILINAKDKKVKGTRNPLPFTKEGLDEIDNEIKSVFSEDKLITPDLVRGEYDTLEASILNKGWPKLATVRGRFLFVLDEKEDKINRYLDGHPSLKNRILFVNSKEGNPEAAFRIVNNPISDFEYIKELVAKGYMVRTRADAGTKEARTNSYERFEKAKASGAQVISTDYYVPTTMFESDFKVIFDDGTYKRIKKQ